MKEVVLAVVVLLGGAGVLAVLAVPVGLTIYGIYLAFSASLIFGIIAVIIEPTPLILGILALFGHPEVAGQAAKWLGLV